jgi:pimeloyl-ACP methyl ester carboxylesterase
MKTKPFRVATCLFFLISVASLIWAEPPLGTEVVTGEKQGALYAIYVPPSWNGDLVLYAHGWTDPAAEIYLPSADELGDALNVFLEDGYAFAHSSYSQNGWAVRQGIKETEQLLPLFRKNFGPPDRVYIFGHSMGGLISVMLAEKHHGKVDGALPICGAVGGAAYSFDYIIDLRVLFDAYYPGVLPGNAIEIPDWVDPFSDIYFPAFLSVLPGYFVGDYTPDPAAVEMSFVEQLGLYANNQFELAESIAQGIWIHGAGVNDLVERCGGVPFDNTEGYTHPSPLIYDPPILNETMLNEYVEHYSIDQNCYAYLKNWYEPNGMLRIPVLSLHESRDPIVPIKHEWDYAAKVAAQGRADLLVQRTKDAWGHCGNFSPFEIKAAFDELVLWVEEGVQPDP